MKSYHLIIYTILIVTLSNCNVEKKSDVEKRPNIIFIMSDDHASHAISSYGGIYDSLAPTPNIDRLANEGVKFNNVFCTNAICGPSRASILTGKYNHINGYYKNESGGVFNADQWTFPQAFQSNGYHTALFGKWHLGTEPVGFDEFRFHTGAGQQGFYWDPEYNENGTIVKEKGYATNLSTDFALRWLDSVKNDSKPFMMCLQYKAPHRPWDPDEKYKDLWEDIEMPYPSTFNDDYKTRETTAGDTDMTMEFFNRRDMKLTPPAGLSQKELIEWNSYGNGRGEVVIPEGMTPEQARLWRYQTYIKDYLACVRSVDDNVGRVLDFLRENDLEENTIVIYTADQGFYLGDHGFFDKRFIYEESLRMPFLMRYPHSLKPGIVNNDIITNIDFAPTIMDYAGIEVPEDVQGKSFKSIIEGSKTEEWRQSMYYHYYEYPYWHHVKPHYGIRNQRYKLAHFYYDTDVWEFYDLGEDPNELSNQINNPDLINEITSMKDELKNLMILYNNDNTLEEFKAITEKDFGKLSN